MQIDQDRIRAILNAEHSIWRTREVAKRKDTRWFHGSWDLIAEQLSPSMRVLDVGCGDGGVLLELSPSFHSGLGIDIDPESIQRAEGVKRAQGIQNVDFLLLDFPRESERLQPESFDMVISLRGPVPDTSESLQATLRLLRPDGLIFCEEIGELHDCEVCEIFDDRYRNNPIISMAEKYRAAMENKGVDIRLAADLFEKWIYPDVYAWLEYQCNLWTWLGIPLPESDDPRIGLFAERNTIATGEIETTHHVVWVAGVKR